MIEWTVPCQRWRRTVEEAQPAFVVDVSLMSLQIRARTGEGFEFGSIAPIRCEGHGGLVNVRWVQPSHVQGVSFYGVKMIGPVGAGKSSGRG